MTDVDEVYAKAAAEGAEGLYRDWASQYDADNAAKGFELPYYMAGFVARHVPVDAGPILDAGAGTGWVGRTLSALGYQDITAIDLSAEMLAVAAAIGCYKDTRVMRLGDPLDFADNHFTAATCVGSFGPGHAPPESLFELARVVRPGGHVIFNVVEATWMDQGFPPVIDNLEGDGVWAAVEKPKPHRAYFIGEPDLYTRAFVFRIL